jgi:hypothetical protein
MSSKRPGHTAPKLLFIIPAIVFATGCKTIVRENIITSIDTGVGASIAENKQTQMYELKAGYIRSQFYSIPTGKLVENDGTANDTAIVTSPKGEISNAKISNAANLTPQVVSGIKMHSGLQDLLLGLDVSENFAVGEVAVNSQAAIAMYIATAQNPSNALAAANALSKLAKTVPSAPPLGMTTLAKAYTQFAADPAKKAEFDAVAQKANYTDFRSFLLSSPAPTQDQIEAVRSELEKDSDIKSKLAELDKTTTGSN